MFQQNFQPTLQVTRDFNFDPLALNLVIPPQKMCNWGPIWALNGQIVQNKSSRIIVKIFKKYTTPIHSEL